LSKSRDENLDLSNNILTKFVMPFGKLFGFALSLVQNLASDSEGKQSLISESKGVGLDLVEGKGSVPFYHVSKLKIIAD